MIKIISINRRLAGSDNSSYIVEELSAKSVTAVALGAFVINSISRYSVQIRGRNAHFYLYRISSSDFVRIRMMPGKLWDRSDITDSLPRRVAKSFAVGSISYATYLFDL